MSPTEAKNILAAHNAWRRHNSGEPGGVRDLPMQDPKLIGEAIDVVVEFIERHIAAGQQGADADLLLTVAVELEAQARSEERKTPGDGDGPSALREWARKLRRLATPKPAGAGDVICPNCERPTSIHHCQACGADFAPNPPAPAPQPMTSQGEEEVWVNRCPVNHDRRATCPRCHGTRPPGAKHGEPVATTPAEGAGREAVEWEIRGKAGKPWLRCTEECYHDHVQRVGAEHARALYTHPSPVADDVLLGQIGYEAAARVTGCDQTWDHANKPKWIAAASAIARRLTGPQP